MRSSDKADRSIGQDLIAGSITALVLLPQAVAFAQLAGLPTALGLAAGMVPTIVYALLGSSRVLAVGPVSVAAIMLASALAPVPVAERPGAALMLAVQVGLLLLALGTLRLGFLANFVSQPVLQGFSMGAALLIILAQLPPLLGLGSGAAQSLAPGPVTFGMALLLAAIVIERLGAMRSGQADRSRFLRLLPRLAPVLIVIIATLFLNARGLGPDLGYAVIGTVAPVLPWPTLTAFGFDRWSDLLPSAALIALIGFVESIAIAKSMARTRKERIDPDRELIALGAANVAGGFTGAMPVAGGLSRTLVNAAAGAQSQRAAVVTALWLIGAGAGLTGVLGMVPSAALAAIIIVAVMPLLRPQELMDLWRYDPRDGAAAVVTLAGTVMLGVEAGVALGVGLSILLALWRSSRPHIAVVGRIPGQPIFRNVERHAVETWPHLLLLRPDASLTFANAEYVREFIEQALGRRPEVRTVVLVCSAVNHIDVSAVEILHALAEDLRARGLSLALAEVKGPVLDRLDRSPRDRGDRLKIIPDLGTTIERLCEPS